MALKEQLAKQTGISIITAGLSMLFGILSFFLLSKLLPREEIAIMGIASGFLATFAFLQLSPDIALFRNYKELKKDFNRIISAFLLFWVARTAVIMSVVSVAAIIVFGLSDRLLLGYIVGSALIANFGMLQASIQEIFYVEFKQKQTLFLNAIYYFLFIVLLLSLALNVFGFHPTLLSYFTIWFALSLIFTVLWVFKLFWEFKFSFILDIRGSYRVIKSIIVNTAIWNHLTSSAVTLVYRADVLFVGLFATAFATGNYTIALMLTSMFVFLPQILQKMCLTGLTRSNTKENDLKIVNAFVKYAFVISLAQFAGYILLGDFVLSFIDATNHASIYELGLYILGGVTLFNIVRPLHSYGTARGSMKKIFFEIFLPAAGIAVAAYALAAWMSGPLAVAQANILVYGTLVLLQVRFARVYLAYVPPSTWITSEERDLLKKIRMRIPYI